MLDEGVDSGLKTQVHDAIGLIEHQHLESVDIQSGRLVKMLQHAPRRADENVHAGETLGLLLEILSANDQAGGESVVATDLAEDFEDLNGELASRGYNEGAKPIELGPLGAVEALEKGHEERKRLSAARLGGAEDVLALEGEGDGTLLDFGEGLEVRGLEARGGWLG
jgi:hypothetical protein